jgi:hypothetical protein
VITYSVLYAKHYSLNMVCLAKGGVEPRDCVTVARHIAINCPHLKVAGLMTIGSPDNSADVRPNPDFLVRYLFSCRISPENNNPHNCSDCLNAASKSEVS